MSIYFYLHQLSFCKKLARFACRVFFRGTVALIVNLHRVLNIERRHADDTIPTVIFYIYNHILMHIHQTIVCFCAYLCTVAFGL